MACGRAAWFFLALGAAVVPAQAQQADERRFHLHAGTGIVTSTDRGMPGIDWQIVAGADLPVTRTWSVRVEGGARIPNARTGHAHSLYYFPAPEGSDTNWVEVPSDIEITKQQVADLAVLLRRRWTPGGAEVGALFGMEFDFVRYRSVSRIPLSAVDPTAFETFHHENSRTLGVIDIGLDAGWKVSPRWMLLAYAIVGFEPPIDNPRKPQFRSGVIVSRR